MNKLLRVEVMMRYECNQAAKNVLYPKTIECFVGEDGFLHVVYLANGKVYQRGISLRSIITYTISDAREGVEDGEVATDVCEDEQNDSTDN